MNIDPIKAAAAVLILALLAIAGIRIHAYGQARYEAGQAAMQAKWDKAVERGRKEVERLRTEAGKVTVRTEVQYRDRVKVIREKGDALVREVPVFVPAGSVLSGGFRLFHDAAAAGGPVPDPAAIADAAPIDAQAVAGTVADNYATFHETAQRLTSLQDWVLAQCKANPPPEGCGARP